MSPEILPSFCRNFIHFVKNLSEQRIFLFNLGDKRKKKKTANGCLLQRSINFIINTYLIYMNMYALCVAINIFIKSSMYSALYTFVCCK